jgi:hypothetical protein
MNSTTPLKASMKPLMLALMEATSISVLILTLSPGSVSFLAYIVTPAITSFRVFVSEVTVMGEPEPPDDPSASLASEAA